MCESDFDGDWHEHPVIRSVGIALGVSGNAFLLAHFAHLPRGLEIAAYVLAILFGGYHWSKEALELLVEEKEIGIEFLMMAATVGSIALGMWDEAAFLVVLYGAAEGLEEYTFARTRASIRKLLDLAPKEARVRRNGQEILIPAQQLKLGDIFIVRPGEALPTDGVILQGRSSVNEASVTGESIPAEKEPGSKVFAATINLNGLLEIQGTATFENNTLSKLVHMVEEARERKGQAQLFIESFGRRYSPTVLAIAVLLLAIPAMFGAPFPVWAARAIVFLVAAAPCALVMSTPVAIAAGIGVAGKHGVLIKGGVHLEALGKIRGVAFDKTGTLTQGKPVVSDIIAFKGDETRILQIASSLEKHSEHPLARAIEKRALEEMIEALPVDAFRAMTGAGVQGKIGERRYYVGNTGFFESLGLRTANFETMARLRQEGKTIAFVGTDNEIQGAIGIQDRVRPEAKKAIAELHTMGLKTVMLTGDNHLTAQAIGRELEIDDVRAELRPEDKVTAIEELTRKHGAIAMAGDGVNDAPALARAAIGIAMGAAGTDAAIEASDIALMGDDLEKLVYAIRLGRRARSISRQNIVFSILILAALIPSALLGLMNVAVAVVAHETSEILAVINGLRVARRLPGISSAPPID